MPARRLSAATVLSLGLLLGGCMSSTPIPSLAPGDLPAGFQGPRPADAPTWPDPAWWQSFNDAGLSELIALVQAGNLDLGIARRNLEAAQLALREAGFNLLPIPVVDFSTGAGYQERRGDGVESSGSLNQPFDLGVGFTYNDILSRAPTYERAVADFDTRAAQAADAALNTLGTAASTYFQLLLTRDKIVAATQNVANAETISQIAQARVDAGVAVPIEALQQRIALERERASLQSLLQNDLAARAALALLSGRNVQDFALPGQSLQVIQVPVVQPGLPSELLQRRPDIVAAEGALRGAAANVDIVRSELFPQISLTGSLNASSSSLSELLSSPDSLLNLNASLVQVLLDNGQRRRNVAQARLSLENSLASYRRTVLGAFNEVEVLLSNIQLLQQLGAVAAGNLEAAEESFRIAQVRYEEGVTDFETVLITQNTLFSSRNAVLDNKLLQLNAMVGLFQALGGGWENGAPLPGTLP